MGFLDGLSNAVDRQVKRNLDYLKQKAHSASDDWLCNWWYHHQDDEYELADSARDIIKSEMDKRGMYY